MKSYLTKEEFTILSDIADADIKDKPRKLRGNAKLYGKLLDALKSVPEPNNNLVDLLWRLDQAVDYFKNQAINLDYDELCPILDGAFIEYKTRSFVHKEIKDMTGYELLELLKLNR